MNPTNLVAGVNRVVLNTAAPAAPTDGVADDACEKCGSKKWDDGGGQAEGDKKGRGEDCKDKCDTTNRPAGPATAWNGTLGAIFLIKLSILPVV